MGADLTLLYLEEHEDADQARRLVREHGADRTPLIPATFDAESVATFGQDVPLGRPGQPAEVAPAYTFLASEDASYITGQVIHPNGGTVVNG